MIAEQDVENPVVVSHLERSVGGFKKLVFLILAGICFVLGVAGVLVPGLPTTPFLLMTSYLLVRSSPRLNARLLRSRFFGPILRDWQLHGSLRKDIKFKAIAVVCISVGVTTFLFDYSTLGVLLVFASAAVGITVILKIPSGNQPSASDRRESTRPRRGPLKTRTTISRASSPYRRRSP